MCAYKIMICQIIYFWVFETNEEKIDKKRKQERQGSFGAESLKPDN